MGLFLALERPWKIIPMMLQATKYRHDLYGLRMTELTWTVLLCLAEHSIAFVGELRLDLHDP